MDKSLHLPNKENLYGRNIKEDQERLYMDNDISVALAVFDHHEIITTSEQFADILKINVQRATDQLDLLRNLGLVELVEGGYALKDRENSMIFHGIQGDEQARRKTHQLKLLKLAERTEFSDRFSDKFSTTCSSQELIIELHNKILEAFTEFHAKNAKLNIKDKKYLLNCALGFVFDDISIKSDKETENV